MAILGLLIGYFIGSVPVGLLVGRRYGIDVRDYGSGKTGFTNVLRSLGLGPALVVWVGDVGKGLAPVLVGSLLLDDPWATAMGGAGSVVGHTWPIFANFRGGRGVATSFGAFLGMSPLVALILLIVAAVILAVTRYASLMSVTSVFSGFVVLVWLVMNGTLPDEYLVFGVVATVSVELSHMGNIRRLLAGTEPKIGHSMESD